MYVSYYIKDWRYIWVVMKTLFILLTLIINSIHIFQSIFITVTIKLLLISLMLKNDKKTQKQQKNTEYAKTYMNVFLPCAQFLNIL